MMSTSIFYIPNQPTNEKHEYKAAAEIKIHNKTTWIQPALEMRRVTLSF